MENNYENFVNSTENLLKKHNLENNFLNSQLRDALDKILDKKNHILRHTLSYESKVAYIPEEEYTVTNNTISENLKYAAESIVFNFNLETLSKNLKRVNKEIVEDIIKAIQDELNKKIQTIIKPISSKYSL